MKAIIGSFIAFVISVGMAWIYVSMWHISWDIALLGMILWNQIWNEIRR